MTQTTLSLTPSKRATGEALLKQAAAIFAAELDSMDVVTNPEEVFPWFQAEIGFKEAEHFACIFLDQGRRVLDRVVYDEGSRTRAVLFPRKVFGTALQCGATGIILSHNHPGGAMMPSPQDRDLTRRVQSLGEGLEVTLIDHVIVAPTGTYASFRKHGWM